MPHALRRYDLDEMSTPDAQSLTTLDAKVPERELVFMEAHYPFPSFLAE